MRQWNKLTSVQQADLETLWAAQMYKVNRGPKQEHEQESHYRDVQIGRLLRRLRGEIEEMVECIATLEDPIEVWKEAADVANFATFIASRYTLVRHGLHELHCK